MPSSLKSDCIKNLKFTKIMKTNNSFAKKYIERLKNDKITIFLFHGVIKKNNFSIKLYK